MSSVSEFPSLPPPIYKPSKLVSLLDCKGLAVREAEHKKWLAESQVSPHAVPIGVRASDLEDELGMDLGIDLDEEEGSLEDSVDEGEQSLGSVARSIESDYLNLDDSELQLLPNETVSVNSDDSLNDSSINDSSMQD